MSSNEDNWAKRRRRLTKCKKHGLHFDSELTSGCALCRKEGLITGPERSGPQFLVLLITLLGLAILAFSLANRIQENRSRAEAEDEGAVASSNKLDPGLMRREIEAMERAVGETPEAGLENAGIQIRSAAQELYAAIDRLGPEGSRPTLLALEDWIQGIPEEGFSPSDLRSARSTWKRIASRGFNSAPWWSSTGSPTQDDGRVILLAYRDAAEALVALADEGAAQVAAYATPELQGDDGWSSFSEDWLLRIEGVGKRLPSRGNLGAESRFLAGVQDLRNALSRLTRLAGDRSLPSRGNAQSNLEEAIDQAERARATFDALLFG